MKYYMTALRQNETGYWEDCKSQTLTAAKRETTYRYKQDYLYAILQVAVGDNVTEQRTVVAQKTNIADRWETI